MIRQLLVMSMIANSAFMHTPAWARSDDQAGERDVAKNTASTAKVDAASIEAARLVRQFMEVSNNSALENELAQKAGKLLVTDVAWYKYFTKMQLNDMQVRVQAMQKEVGTLKTQISESEFNRKVAILDKVVTTLIGEIGLESEESRKNAVYFAGMTTGIILTVIGTVKAWRMTNGHILYGSLFGFVTFASGMVLTYTLVKYGMQTQMVQDFATQDISKLSKSIDQVFGNTEIEPAALPAEIQNAEKFEVEQSAMKTWLHSARQIGTFNPKTIFLLGNIGFNFGQKLKYVQRNYQKIHSFDIMTDINGSVEQNDRIAHVELQSILPLDNQFEIKDKNGTVVGFIQAAYELGLGPQRVYKILDAKKKLIAKSDNSSLYTLNMTWTTPDGSKKLVEFTQATQSAIGKAIQQTTNGKKYFVGDNWTVKILDNSVDRRLILAAPMIKSSMDDLYMETIHQAADAAKSAGDLLRVLKKY